MSSAAAGKFQDHYKLLGIDPKASPDVIQMAYNALKNLYDTQTGTEPNLQKLEEINLALEVLMDPVSRKMFDSVRGGDDDREISFSGMDFFNSLQHERDRRMTMLCVLYDVRRQNPRVPLITMRQFEKIVNMTEEQIQLSLWYVKTLGFVAVDDKSKMQITAQGMDFLSANAPDPAAIWPHLKNPSGPRPDEKKIEEKAPEVKGIASLSAAVESFGAPTKPAEESRPKTLSMIRRAQVAITEA